MNLNYGPNRLDRTGVDHHLIEMANSSHMSVRCSRILILTRLCVQRLSSVSASARANCSPRGHRLQSGDGGTSYGEYATHVAVRACFV